MSDVSLCLLVRPALSGEMEIWLSGVNGPRKRLSMSCRKSSPPFAIVRHPKYNQKEHQLEWSRSVPRRSADRILGALPTAKVGLIPAWSSGCDGPDYELTIANGFNAITLKWWSYLPTEWSFLQEAVEELLRIADFEALERECEKYVRLAERQAERKQVSGKKQRKKAGSGSAGDAGEGQ